MSCGRFIKIQKNMNFSPKLKNFYIRNKTTFLVLFLYFIITVLFNLPLFFHFSSKIPGDNVSIDYYYFLNSLWWIKFSFLQHLGVYITDYFYYPQSFNFIFNQLLYLWGIITIPLQIIFNLNVAYNIIYLTNFLLSSFCTFLLIKHLSKNNYAAFFSGLVFAFCPYIFAHSQAGHLNLINIWVFPLFIYFFIRSFDNKNLYWLWATIVLSLTAYTDFQYLMFLFLFVFFYIIWQIVFNRKNTRKIVKKISLMVIVAVILTLPLFYYCYKAFKINNFAEDAKWYNTYCNGDLASYILPNPLNPVIAQNTPNFLQNIVGGIVENSSTLSYVGLFLTILCLVKIKNKKKWFWLYIFIVFFILSMGPQLQFAGRVFNINLPYYYLKKIFPFSLGLVPPRFIILSILSLAILSGYTVKYILEKYHFDSDYKKKIYIIIAMASLQLFEYFPGTISLVNLDNITAQKLAEISQEKDDFTILTIPNYLYSSYYQTLHNKKTIGGEMGRRSDKKYLAYYKNIPGLKYLFEPDKTLDENDLNKVLVYEEFTKIKLKYIIVNKLCFYSNNETICSEKIVDYLENVLQLRKNYEDENNIIYQVSSN